MALILNSIDKRLLVSNFSWNNTLSGFKLKCLDTSDILVKRAFLGNISMIQMWCCKYRTFTHLRWIFLQDFNTFMLTVLIYILSISPILKYKDMHFHSFSGGKKVKEKCVNLTYLYFNVKFILPSGAQHIKLWHSSINIWFPPISIPWLVLSSRSTKPIIERLFFKRFHTFVGCNNALHFFCFVESLELTISGIKLTIILPLANSSIVVMVIFSLRTFLDVSDIYMPWMS